jgi:hypothetical protein
MGFGIKTVSHDVDLARHFKTEPTGESSALFWDTQKHRVKFSQLIMCQLAKVDVLQRFSDGRIDITAI